MDKCIIRCSDKPVGNTLVRVYPATYRKLDTLTSKANRCQRQAENVDFRRNGMSFFGGQHSSVYSPYAPLHLPA